MIELAGQVLDEDTEKGTDDLLVAGETNLMSHSDPVQGLRAETRYVSPARAMCFSRRCTDIYW